MLPLAFGVEGTYQRELCLSVGKRCKQRLIYSKQTLVNREDQGRNNQAVSVYCTGPLSVLIGKQIYAVSSQRSNLDTHVF